MWEDICQPTVTSVIFSFIIIYFLTKDVIQFCYFLLYHYILSNKGCIIIIQISRFVLISLLITLLYHYIFLKHSLCIAIHLSIFLLYHYILINTKCHITDSCIIISPLSLYSNHFYLTITIQICQSVYYLSFIIIY